MVAITITADAKSKLIDPPDQIHTYKNTSGSLLLVDTFTGTLIHQPGESFGTYPILLRTLSLSDYYEITYVGANLTITGGMIFLPMIQR